MRRWVTGVLERDPPVDAARSRAGLDDRVLTVEGGVHLIGVRPRHHVRRIGAYLQCGEQLAGLAIERDQPVAEPLGVVDQALVAARPHVVAVVEGPVWGPKIFGHLPLTGWGRGAG